MCQLDEESGLGHECILAFHVMSSQQLVGIHMIQNFKGGQNSATIVMLKGRTTGLKHCLCSREEYNASIHKGVGNS